MKIMRGMFVVLAFVMFVMGLVLSGACSGGGQPEVEEPATPDVDDSFECFAGMTKAGDEFVACFSTLDFCGEMRGNVKTYYEKLKVRALSPCKRAKVQVTMEPVEAAPGPTPPPPAGTAAPPPATPPATAEPDTPATTVLL